MIIKIHRMYYVWGHAIIISSNDDQFCDPLIPKMSNGSIV